MHIRIDDPRGTEIAALLKTHLDDAALHSPPKSVHALDLEALRAPEITFWTVRDSGELLGCGALKNLGGGYGEIKSMFVDPDTRRAGVAAGLIGRCPDTGSQTRLVTPLASHLFFLGSALSATDRFHGPNM